MTTQANGPAQAQVQQPAHPIHEETATLEKLTKFVSENPDNDPHEGTEMEEPKAPPAEAKEEPKGAPEAKEEAKEEGATIELDEDTPFFELEYGGKKEKLTAKQIREGYLAKQDYHRNIQKVKQQESELQQKAQQAEATALQQYAQRIEVHQQAVQRLAGVKSMAEIEALAKQDPAAAQQEFLRFVNVSQTMQALEAEKQAAIGKHQQMMQGARAKAIEQSRQTLEADIPNWNADLYNKVLGSVSSDYGFQKGEVEQVIDARLVKVFHDAYQYRQLQKAKPEISKKVVAVPKVIKPGSAEKPNTSTTAIDEAAQRLQKTGKGEDFVDWYTARQKQQKRK
jgi:hypothetical protein